MSQQTEIELVGCLIWFFIGAAVLSATRRGLLDVTEAMGKDESLMNIILPVLKIPGLAILNTIAWVIVCMLWPWSLLRFFRRLGLINGHIARNCPHRILHKEREDKTRNLYRHGACTRREP